MIFTRRRFYTEQLIHTQVFTHGSFHTDAFTHGRFCTQTHLHSEVFSQGSLHTEHLLDTARRRIYTQMDAFTQERFYTHSSFDRRTLLHKNVSEQL